MSPPSGLVLAVVGSRDYEDYPEFCQQLGFLLSTAKVPVSLVSGGANGADSLAEQYAQEHGLKIKVHPADWGRHGKAAGMIRNGYIVHDCTALLAFWDGKSTGTAHSINLAKRLGRTVFVFNFKTKRREAFNRKKSG